MPLARKGRKRQAVFVMDDAAQKIREWLREGIARSGLSAKAWAEKAEVSPSTVQRALKDDYAFVTSSRTLAKLAAVAGIAPPEIEALTRADGERPEFRRLPIRYEVGAGIWRAVDDLIDPTGFAPVAYDDQYAGFNQWLERVVGDSMNLEYPPGTLLHVIDAIGIGYAPRSGDHVIVERLQDGGLAERTCKEIVVSPGRTELWSRSMNPRWSEPLVYSEKHAQDHVSIEIVGYVVGSYRRRPA